MSETDAAADTGAASRGGGLRRLVHRLRPSLSAEQVRRGGARALTAVLALLAATGSAVAQEGGDFCSEGLGLLIFDTQVMLWQIVVGALIIMALLGLVLRAFPIFAGATAFGNMALLGVVVGLIGFVFIIQFIGMASGYIGGVDAGAGCSPFTFVAPVTPWF